jgi:4-diphosphocytidyl-2-C-methyl-D-erythritol kinase
VIITELAPAKINLTLVILGRRPDGYHELASLVVFADVGDNVTLDTRRPVGLTVSGPFGAALAGENLIDTALLRLAAADPAVQLGAVHLDKRLPVAAGMGGGSADAAAVLRAVRRANPGAAISWATLARSLGADVPVCLLNTAAWVTGTGETLAPCDGMPELYAVLANPLAPVPPDKTARVFRALAAGPVTRPQQPSPAAPRSLDDVLALMGACRNDLETPACSVVPESQVVLTALLALPGAAVVRMSGAGPTSFGLFATAAQAQSAAELLQRSRPEWWVRTTRITSPCRRPIRA